MTMQFPEDYAPISINDLVQNAFRVENEQIALMDETLHNLLPEPLKDGHSLRLAAAWFNEHDIRIVKDGEESRIEYPEYLNGALPPGD